MTFSKQLFLNLIFIFLLLNALEAKRCYSSSCGDVDVRFWLFPNHFTSCGHAGFNLLCTDRHETALKLPKSTLFLVREIDYEKTSLEGKCFSSSKFGFYDFILLVLKLVCLLLVALLVAITTSVVYVTFSSERLPRQIRRTVTRIFARKPPTGPAKYLITTLYKKVELEENMKLPGRNDVICPICLSEYARNEIVGCLLGCEHCFHIECISTWLKLHCSCPICRNEVSPQTKVCKL